MKIRLKPEVEEVLRNKEGGNFVIFVLGISPKTLQNYLTQNSKALVHIDMLLALKLYLKVNSVEELIEVDFSELEAKQNLLNVNNNGQSN